VIGDSISGNYDASLRHALAGKVNVYHPPESAGSTRIGRKRIRSWLGAFREEGRGWDAITFNFGHWNPTGPRNEPETRKLKKYAYKSGLEYIISEIELTGARLIWVTTAPIPRGFGVGDEGFASGKSALINEWADEVMVQHPEISVVDHYGFVVEDPLYSVWWTRRDVHFTPTLAEPLGRAIAREVLRVLKIGGDIPPARPLSRAEVENQHCCLPLETYERMSREAQVVD